MAIGNPFDPGAAQRRGNLVSRLRPPTGVGAAPAGATGPDDDAPVPDPNETPAQRYAREQAALQRDAAARRKKRLAATGDEEGAEAPDDDDYKVVKPTAIY